VSDITVILEKIQLGDTGASTELLPLVYNELRRIAAARMALDSGSHSLQPTALVHEAWLRLGGERQADWQSRRHFFGAAAHAMRQILIERARRRRATRHGGGLTRVDVAVLDQATAETPGDAVLAVSAALDRMSSIHPEKAELVRLRYFVGLTLEEAAATMGLSLTTAKRYWAFARAWLAREIER
jgi:RNA polymerase sigma factor (TIGR02999 family)